MQPLYASYGIKPKSTDGHVYTHHYYYSASPNEVMTQASRVYTPLLLLRYSKGNDHASWPRLHTTDITR